MKIFTGFGGVSFIFPKWSLTITPMQWGRHDFKVRSLSGGMHRFIRFGCIEIVTPNT